MSSSRPSIPLDKALSQAAVEAELAALRAQLAVLTAENTALKEARAALEFWNRQLQRALFGPRSEKRLDPDQRDLFVEDVEQNLAESQATVEAASARVEQATGTAQPRRPARNIGNLPAHLPRERREIIPASTQCACCGQDMHRIGEDVSERLKVIPRRYVVDQIVRPRFACRACQEGVVQAPAPENAITGGMADASVLAEVVVQKYAWHLPLYRQSQILAGIGIDLDRSTLARWVGATAWWLRPLHDLLVQHTLSRAVLFCDETPMPILEPGKGRVNKATLWAVASDERPFGSNAPPAVFYHPGTRATADAREVLAGFRGLLKVDGYGVYKNLAEETQGELTLSFCLAHARRKLHDVFKQNNTPEAGQLLDRIGELYALEKTIRGQPPQERRRARQSQAVPILNTIKDDAEQALTRFSGKSPFAKALRYLLGHWHGITNYCDDGRLEIDTNTVERQMRPIALGRKNHLFAGSEAGARHWALFASLVNTAKLNEVDPQTWFTDVLERIISGKVKANALETLLPWNWTAAQTQKPYQKHA